MFACLAGSVFIVKLILDGFQTLNLELLSVLNFEVGKNMFELFIGGIAIIAAAIFFTLGVALILFVMIFIGFFFVAGFRLLALYILLALIPLAIVLYFFDSTKKIGSTIFSITFANLLILPIWLIIFSAASDIIQTPTSPILMNLIIPGSSSAVDMLSFFFLLGAFSINTIIFYKINAFFASLSFEKGAQKVVSQIITRERLTTIRERVTNTQRLDRSQMRLTDFKTQALTESNR
jgi:hypothetical protein